jgi:hypothetical protein
MPIESLDHKVFMKLLLVEKWEIEGAIGFPIPENIAGAGPEEIARLDDDRDAGGPLFSGREVPEEFIERLCACAVDCYPVLGVEGESRDSGAGCAGLGSFRYVCWTLNSIHTFGLVIATELIHQLDLAKYHDNAGRVVLSAKKPDLRSLCCNSPQSHIKSTQTRRVPRATGGRQRSPGGLS